MVVDYDRLLARPDHELGRMAAELGLPDTEIRRDCVAAFKRDFLADEMRHAHYHSDDLGNAAAVPLAAELHALTQDLASDIENASDAVTSGRIEDLFVRMNAFAPLLSYAGITERVADDVPRLEGELAWARSSLAEATTYNGSLQESLHQKDEAIQVSENYTEDLLASIARKDRELVAAHAEMDATQAKMDATHAKLIEVEGKLQLVAERAWQRLISKIPGNN